MSCPCSFSPPVALRSHLQLVQVVLQAVEAPVPEPAILGGPLGDFLQGCCSQLAGTPLGFTSSIRANCGQAGCVGRFVSALSGRPANQPFASRTSFPCSANALKSCMCCTDC